MFSSPVPSSHFGFTHSEVPTIRITHRMAAAAVGLLIFWRFWYASLRQLVPDEALYWEWSRHLSIGYLDHPPMIAWLIWLSTKVLGTDEFGVRFFGVLLPFASVAIILWLSWRLWPDNRALYWTGAILLLSPLVNVMATIFTPDTPMIFFGTGAMAVAMTLPDASGSQSRWTRAWRWLLFGFLVGLSLLSKYTGILVPIAVMAAFLSCRAGRDHLRSPWPYLSLVLALAVFSPVIWWNGQHNWASFRFQLSHGLSESSLTNPLVTFAEFIGGQAFVWTPVLLCMGLFILIFYWRSFQTLDLPHRILVCTATLPLVFFTLASLRSHSEVNWPALAYFPLTLLTVRYLGMKNWTGYTLKWIRLGCIIAIGSLIIVQAPELLWAVHVPLPDKIDQLYCWDETAEEVQENARELPLVANHYQDAAELAFYTDGRPEVWAVGIGSRVTAYDYFSNPPDFSAMPRLAFIGTHVDLFCEKYGFEQISAVDAKNKLPSGRVRTRALTILQRRDVEPMSVHMKHHLHPAQSS